MGDILRRYILDLPGDADDLSTERGKFSDELYSLIAFKPGMKMFSLPWGVESIVNFEANPDRFNSLERLITNELFEKLKALLERYNIKHEETGIKYKLCCEETTKKSSILSFSNYIYEPVFCFTSEEQLYSTRPVAYINKFSAEDERLQRPIIEDIIDYRKKHPE